METKKSNRGGARKGAGRKRKSDLIAIRDVLDTNIDRKFVVKRLHDLIDNGDIRAIELYLKYRVGLPTKSVEVFQESFTDLNFQLNDILKFKEDI